MTRVKICCMASVEEARAAVAHGAAALGLVSAMPSGPGPIPEARIAEIAGHVPPGVTTVLLTAHTEPEAIVEQQRRCGVSAIQLVDRVTPADRRAIRDALPGVALIQVVHVEGPDALEAAREAAEASHALLLDSGRPGAPVRELGGTGRVHDWEVSREIVEVIDRPVFLAGGLHPGNVVEAIRRVRPFGVDVCSGLRENGALDEERLAAFMAGVGRAG